MISKAELKYGRCIIFPMRKIIALITTILFTSLTNAELNLELPDLNLPNLGGQSSITIESHSEKEIGLSILRGLRASGNLIEDAEINTWLRSIGNRLSSNAPRSSTPYYFVISREQSINAFATLGGVIVVNSGLILQTNSESELAAVMAHEIAHITQRHIPRMIREAEGNKFATGAALVAGILASTKDLEAGQAIINLSLATMAHKQLTFSREAEAEADRVGLRILARAKFNPKSMPLFLAKLEQFSGGDNAGAREYLQSHPLTIKRVSDTQSRAQRIHGYRGSPSKSYYYMKEKIRRASKSNISISNQLSDNVRNYSEGLKLAQQNKYIHALKMINGKSLSELILRGELLNKLKRYKETVIELEPLVKIYLGNEALSQLLSRAYGLTGQLDKAWATVSDVSISEQTSLEFLEEKQEVARMTGRRSMVYRVLAEKSIRIGDYDSAKTLLGQALKLPLLNENELLSIQNRLDQIKN